MSELASVKILDALNDIEKNRAIFILKIMKKQLMQKNRKIRNKIKWKRCKILLLR